MGFILLEYFIAKRKGLNYFNLHNSIANVSVGIAERLCDVLVTSLFFFVYDYVQKHFGIFNIKQSWLLFILLLLCTDFLWYWYHRLAHEVNVLWAVHVVHHQSEDFNFTVAARITVLQALARTCFWVILPLIGFPATMITAMLLLHGIYPFFVHTRLIGKLGILEYIFVTPSHHRVHHASNEKYLDKNYGDMFIIWDKIFGTFKKEEEEPVYGLTKPLNTYSFLWQHFHFYIEIWLCMKEKKTLKEKFLILFQRPEKINADARGEAEEIFRIKRNEEVIAHPLNKYVVWQIISILGLLFVFILFEHHFDVTVKLIFTAATILTLINCGAIMEQKKWIFYIEVMRFFAVAAIPFCIYMFDVDVILFLFLITSFAALLLALYFQSLKVYYLKTVYRFQENN